MNQKRRSNQLVEYDFHCIPQLTFTNIHMNQLLKPGTLICLQSLCILSAHVIPPAGFITGSFSSNIFYHNSSTDQLSCYDKTYHREETSQFLQTTPPTNTCPVLLHCLSTKLQTPASARFPRMFIINFTFFYATE